MNMLFVLIVFMLACVVCGKLNWRSEATKILLAAIAAFLQTALVVYLMMTMKFPWS